MKSSVKVSWMFWQHTRDRRFWTVSGLGDDPTLCGFKVSVLARAVVDDFGNLVAVA
jgi:hypothetical protein